MARKATGDGGASDRPKAKVGRPPSGKPWNTGRPIRVDPALAMMAKAVATARGIGIGEYLGSLCEDQVRRDYAKVIKGQSPDGGA